VTDAHADLSGQDQRRRGQRARDGGGGLGQRGNKWWTLAGVCLGTFMLLKRAMANLAKRDIAQLTTLVKTRLRRMQYQPRAYRGLPRRNPARPHAPLPEHA